LVDLLGDRFVSGQADSAVAERAQCRARLIEADFNALEFKGDGQMASVVSEWLTKPQHELDEIFSAHEAGPIPSGQAKGTAIIAPGTPYSSQIAEMINHFAWQGKVFDAEHGFLRNLILPFGLKAIVAKVYKDPSWLDGKDCIVLDYSETSLVASHIRDEIRMIEPGAYLGKVYWDKKRLIDFALEFNVQPAA